MIETILEYTMVYLLWTFAIWAMHWFAHNVNGPLMRLHDYHHKQYFIGAYTDPPPRWIQLLGFYTTDWRDIMEQTTMEIIPTIPVCIMTGHWWPLVIIWADNAFLSPYIDHDPKVRKGWWLAYGVFHTDHHENPTVNYGFYTILWDAVFGTFKQPAKVKA